MVIPISTDSEQLMAMVDEAADQAVRRYNRTYDNRLYMRAVEGSTVERANAVIDEALCLCGSPYYRHNLMLPTQAELDFLRPFIGR